MEVWHPPHNLSAEIDYQSTSRTDRALENTSGNAQPLGPDIKDGNENQNPIWSEYRDFNLDVKTGLSQHPTITQNLQLANHQVDLQRLQARRRRPTKKIAAVLSAGRDYLRHPKYIEYRARPRKDIGEDGKPIWDDKMEEVFQDALIAIPPMGRKKISQHGQSYGRNQLITEYIIHRTGQYRDRKQVSSHLQVLKTVMKGVPGWNASRKPNDRPQNRCHYETKYDENSIEHMVDRTYPDATKESNGLPMNSFATGLPLAAFTLGSNDAQDEQSHIYALNFEMWVSPPNPFDASLMDEALHVYTAVQSTYSVAQPANLESVKDWRLFFPHLPPQIEQQTSLQHCDIIMLEAGLRLMTDFPPKFSKLGISLELDFTHTSNNMKELVKFREWSCTTRIYHHGDCIRESRKEWHETVSGKIKPTFESKWWAKIFTDLTEKMVRAEYSNDAKAVASAAEESREWISGISAMQELFVNERSSTATQQTCTERLGNRRMAILLWKFTQVQTNSVGTTTWQRLIPPPNRILINSPLPSQALAMPSMDLDTIVVDWNDGTPWGTASPAPGSLSQDSYSLCNAPFEGIPDELSHASFDTAFNGDDNICFALQPDFDVSLNAGSLPHLGLPSLENIPFDMYEMVLEGHNETQTVADTSIVHSATAEEQVTLQGVVGQEYHVQEAPLESAEPHPRQPLSNFDLNTHKLLQEQLGEHAHDY